MNFIKKHIIKNRRMTITRKTIKNLIDSFNAENSVLVFTLVSLILGLLLISFMVCKALFSTVL